MFESHSRWLIGAALHSHVRGEWTVCQLPRKPARRHELAVDAHLPRAVACLGARPKMVIASAIDLALEAIGDALHHHEQSRKRSRKVSSAFTDRSVGRSLDWPKAQ